MSEKLNTFTDKNLERFFQKSELIPVIVQEQSTKEVLMLAYMNLESLRKTLETGYTWFYSRSRQELWNKGATSGHVQRVIELYTDCDDDTLLAVGEQTGGPLPHREPQLFLPNHRGGCTMSVLQELYQTVESRKTERQEGSYTCYLFEKGLDKILKKCGEECSEVIIAAKNGDNKETVLELSDLLYHLTVLMVNEGISWQDVEHELSKRELKTGNLKQFHQVDKNS